MFFNRPKNRSLIDRVELRDEDMVDIKPEKAKSNEDGVQSVQNMAMTAEQPYLE